MTDTAKLEKLIAESGIKKVYIAQQMGISCATLYNYINNRAELRQSHIETLSEILGLDGNQKLAIFFAPSGGLKPPNNKPGGTP